MWHLDYEEESPGVSDQLSVPLSERFTLRDVKAARTAAAELFEEKCADGRNRKLLNPEVVWREALRKK